MISHEEWGRLAEHVARDSPLFAGAIFAVVGAIIDVVAEVLSFVATSIATAVAWIVATALPAIFAALSRIGRVIGKGFKYFFKGFRHVLSDIVHGRFVKLYHDYLDQKDKLHEWVEEHLGWLLKLRKAFDDWYRNTIIPILNLIHGLRAVLAVFRIFHLKFAEKLDALLGRLESKIIRNTLVLRSKINEILTFVDLVLDPGLLIRQNVLLASAERALNGLFALLGLGWGRTLTAAEEAREKQSRDSITRAGVIAEAATHPSVGISPELLLAADKAERALPPLEGDKESRLA